MGPPGFEPESMAPEATRIPSYPTGPQRTPNGFLNKYFDRPNLTIRASPTMYVQTQTRPFCGVTENNGYLFPKNREKIFRNIRKIFSEKQGISK